MKDEHTKAAETFSVWQEYSDLSESCSLHLQNLRHQWEELSSPSRSGQDVQTVLRSVEVSSPICTQSYLMQNGG